MDFLFSLVLQGIPITFLSVRLRSLPQVSAFSWHKENKTWIELTGKEYAMPKDARLLTVKEVNAISKPGLTAVGGVTRLYLHIDPKFNGRSYVLRYTNACG